MEYSVQLELRKLKYEIFAVTEYAKFSHINSPTASGVEDYNVLFDDKLSPTCEFLYKKQIPH